MRMWFCFVHLPRLSNFPIFSQFFSLISMFIQKKGLYDSFTVFNPLQPGVTFLYPLKTPPDVFRGYRKATPGCNGLIFPKTLCFRWCLFTNFSYCSYRQTWKCRFFAGIVAWVCQTSFSTFCSVFVNGYLSLVIDTYRDEEDELLQLAIQQSLRDSASSATENGEINSEVDSTTQPKKVYKTAESLALERYVCLWFFFILNIKQKFFK